MKFFITTASILLSVQFNEVCIVRTIIFLLNDCKSSIKYVGMPIRCKQFLDNCMLWERMFANAWVMQKSQEQLGEFSLHGTPLEFIWCIRSIVVLWYRTVMINVNRELTIQ